MNFFYKIFFLFLFSNCESKHLLPYNYVGFEKVKFQVLQISRQDVLNYPDKIARMFFISYHWDEGFVWSQSKAVEECLASSRDGLTEKKNLNNWARGKNILLPPAFSVNRIIYALFQDITWQYPPLLPPPLSLYLHYFWVTLVKRGSRITTACKNLNFSFPLKLGPTFFLRWNSVVPLRTTESGVQLSPTQVYAIKK